VPNNVLRMPSERLGGDLGRVTLKLRFMERGFTRACVNSKEVDVVAASKVCQVVGRPPQKQRGLVDEKFFEEGHPLV
jgi:hypothetical protein